MAKKVIWDSSTKKLEEFTFHQQRFDEVAEILSASTVLLAQIQCEYDTTIRRVRSKRLKTCTSTCKENLKDVEVTTNSNYLKHIKHLSVKVEKLRSGNKRLTSKIKCMRYEREVAFQKREYAFQQLRKDISEAMRDKRCTLKLTIGDSISITQLQKYLHRVKCILVEAVEITEKKYVASQKKVYLQKQLKEKEEIRSDLSAVNNTLYKRLNQSKLALESSNDYLQRSHSIMSQLSLMNFTKNTLKANQSRDRHNLSEEELEDQIKELETELALDCFEKFNDLFENEKYEEAALYAATSPRGLLRTSDTFSKFELSSRHQPGKKLPLLYYCEVLVHCSGAFEHKLTLKESLQLAECVMEHGIFPKFVHWIFQDLVPCSIELGSLVFKYCKCVQSCHCEYKNLAFTIFEKCGAHQQAAVCLVHQEKYVSFLSYAKKRILISNEVCNLLLYHHPKAEFAHCLVLPPLSYQPFLTPFEAIRCLLNAKAIQEMMNFLHTYLQECQVSCSYQNNKTFWERWTPNLLKYWQQNQLEELVIETFAILTVNTCLTCVNETLHQEVLSKPSDLHELSLSHQPIDQFSTGQEEILSGLGDESSCTFVR